MQLGKFLTFINLDPHSTPFDILDSDGFNLLDEGDAAHVNASDHELFKRMFSIPQQQAAESRAALQRGYFEMLHLITVVLNPTNFHAPTLEWYFG